MLSKLSTTTQIVAGFVIVASVWQPIRAAEDTPKRHDEARLVLLEEYVEEVAAAAKEIADPSSSEGQITQANAHKRAAADAINAIATDYFLHGRIKLAESDDQAAQTKYLREVSLLHQIIVQANQCKDGDAAQASKKLTSLVEEFRDSMTDEGQPAEKPADSPNEKPDEPKKEDGADKPGGAGEDEIDKNISKQARDVIKLVNDYRKKKGLATMQLDESLCFAARDHSGDMQKLDFFSHQSPIPGKYRFTDRAKKAGTTANAENISKGSKDARMAVSQWLNSELHRKNIEGNYARIGVGVAANGLYTLKFGK